MNKPRTADPSSPLAPPSRIRVFGHHDLDGIASAAVTGLFLKEQGADVSFSSIDFNKKREWRHVWKDLLHGRGSWGNNGSETPDGLAIVDFLPAPVPTDHFLLYADHHGGALDGDEVSSETQESYRYRASKGEPIFFDPSAGSCATLLRREFSSRYGWTPPPSLARALDLAHRSDTADFESAAEAVALRTSQLARLDLVSTELSEREVARSMEALAMGAEPEEALIDLHGSRAEEILSVGEAAVEAYQNSLRFIAPGAALFDFTTTETPPSRIRYAEYVNPEVEYAIQLRLNHAAGSVHGLIGRTPWAQPLKLGQAHPDVSEVARRYADGGGHPYAAGFQVKSGSIQRTILEARAIARIMGAHLHTMDRSDPFADTRTIPSQTAVPDRTTRRGGVR